ncbi:hypothetical protein VNO77_31100 [Canavalia gladiata]|uniref:Uncharacterized protein n=1 Tax=Canavalia gladiata TaxID=3824 RepID=A0AAN9KRE9_CANGL
MDLVCLWYFAADPHLPPVSTVDFRNCSAVCLTISNTTDIQYRSVLRAVINYLWDKPKLVLGFDSPQAVISFKFLHALAQGRWALMGFRLASQSKATNYSSIGLPDLTSKGCPALQLHHNASIRMRTMGLSKSNC